MTANVTAFGPSRPYVDRVVPQDEIERSRRRVAGVASVAERDIARADARRGSPEYAEAFWAPYFARLRELDSFGAPELETMGLTNRQAWAFMRNQFTVGRIKRLARGRYRCL